MTDFLIKDKNGKFKKLSEGHLQDVPLISVKPTDDQPVPAGPSPVRASSSTTKIIEKNSNNDKTVTETTTADDFFDAPEVEQFKSEKKATLNKQVIQYLEEAAQNIVKSTQIKIDPAHRGRLHNIVLLFLKGLRDKLLTKESLQKGIAEGGVQLNNQDTQRVFQVILSKEKEIKQKLSQLYQAEKSKPQSGSIDNKAQALSSLRKIYAEPVLAEKDILQKLVKEKGPQSHPPVPKTVIGDIKKAPSAPVISPKTELPSIPAVQPTVPKMMAKSIDIPRPPELPKTIKIPKIRPLVIKRQSSGLTLTDVVPPAKVMEKEPLKGERPTFDLKRVHLVGPVAELQDMTVVDFRRLAERPKVRAEKIIEKIKSLEEMSLLDKIKGIEAWKSNQVYNLYVQVGFESLETGLSVEDIIAKRLLRKQDTLNKEEFDVVLWLNEQLTI